MNSAFHLRSPPKPVPELLFIHTVQPTADGTRQQSAERVGGRASIYSLDVAFSVFNFGEPLSFVYLEIISDLQKRNKNKTQGLLSNLHADLPILHILVRFFFSSPSVFTYLYFSTQFVSVSYMTCLLPSSNSGTITSKQRSLIKQ